MRYLTLKQPIKNFLWRILAYRHRKPLPYDHTNGVIYDKDEAINCYTDEFLMACASAGDLNLLLMTTSSSISPFNKWVTSADYDRMLDERNQMISHALDSGFHNVPDHVSGTKGHLVQPSSGDIAHTRPIGSEGAHRIVQEAQKAKAEKPIVAVMCGPLTVLADAYLIDPSIAHKMVVAWFGGSIMDMRGYNGPSDPWAAYIILNRFTMVQFQERTPHKRFAYSPIVEKERLYELPDTPLRKWMINKQHPNGAPRHYDADAPPAISVMRCDYSIWIRSVEFSHWRTLSGRAIPAFKPTSRSKTWVVEKADRQIATQEWWRALKNPKAYHPQPLEIPK
jgi:hypothetical protein